jgi:hypothetical protein
LPSSYEKELFHDGGECCDACRLKLENFVNKSKAIRRVEINYIVNIRIVQYDPNLISNMELREKLRNIHHEFFTVRNNC